MRVCSNHGHDNRLPRNRCSGNRAACGRPRAGFLSPQAQAAVAPPRFGSGTHAAGNTDNTAALDGDGEVGAGAVVAADAACRDRGDWVCALVGWVATVSW